ncbi:MAG: hypothetical protein WA020_10450 [Candidatus Acidiferrales bacterium]
MKMRIKLTLCAVMILLPQIQAEIRPENAPELVRMVELFGAPDHFNGKLVTIIGYLVIGGQNVNADSTLSLDREDYENQIGNGVGVVPSPEMLRDRKELTGMYVRITGVIVTRERPRGRMLGIGNITECTIWSNPEHPRALYPPPPPEGPPPK